jgi:hypothetical protein
MACLPVTDTSLNYATGGYYYQFDLITGPAARMEKQAIAPILNAYAR